MLPFVIVLACLLLFLSAGFLWGYLRTRNRARDAAALITTVAETEVQALAADCVQVFREKLSLELALDQPEAAAQILEAALARQSAMKTVTAFERHGHTGWYAKAIGAFLGELIRGNSKAHWIPAKGGGLALVIGQEPDTMTLHPFDKIIKQYAIGNPGDIAMYVKVAIGGPAMLAAARKTELPELPKAV